jgi:putative addiction module killer protein
MKYAIEQTREFEEWHQSLDKAVRVVVARRMEQASHGLFGDVKYNVGERVSEMRIHIGAGYRLFFTVRNKSIIFMLCGSSKKNQQSEISRAEKIEKES